MKETARKKFLLILSISFLIGLFLLTTASDKRPDKNMDQATGPDNVVVVEGELIADFPNIPMYPSTDVLSSTRVEGKDKIEYTATLHITSVEPLEAADWYDERLRQAGYNFSDTYTGPEEVEEVEIEGGIYQIRAIKDEISYVFRIQESADSGSEVLVEAEIDLD